MIKISADEAKFLRSKNRGHDVHMSSATHHAKAKRYYLTTSPKSVRLLDEYRNSKTVTTFTR